MHIEHGEVHFDAALIWWRRASDRCGEGHAPQCDGGRDVGGGGDLHRRDLLRRLKIHHGQSVHWSAMSRHGDHIQCACCGWTGQDSIADEQGYLYIWIALERSVLYLLIPFFFIFVTRECLSPPLLYTKTCAKSIRPWLHVNTWSSIEGLPWSSHDRTSIMNSLSY